MRYPPKVESPARKRQKIVKEEDDDEPKSDGGSESDQEESYSEWIKSEPDEKFDADGNPYDF